MNTWARFLISLIFFTSFYTAFAENDEPVVGILCQEVNIYLEMISPGHNCYIASSYVKFVESGGARAVPIMIGENRSYYETILGKINGVLFPGGEAFMDAKNGYENAAEIIYDIAKEKNENGIYFPIWGTCLGYESLLFLSINKTKYRQRCFSQRQAIPLDFKTDVNSSRLYSKASEFVMKTLATENVTVNFHVYCVTEEKMREHNLTDQWRVLSTNIDRIGTHFVSSVEHKRYPFYGVQFHPEKNIFEWVRGRNIPHSTNAILSNRYFGEYFNTEVRKNNQTFDSHEELLENLISNYQTTFVGPHEIQVYQDVYFFDKK